MFKKILVLFVIILLICLSCNAMARGTVTFSEDFGALNYNGYQYSRFMSSLLYTDVYNEMNVEVELSSAQNEALQKVYLCTSDTENVIEATVTYKDGAILSIKFIRNDYLDEYNDMLNHTDGHSFIDFEWPTNNTVDIDLSRIEKSDITLKRVDLYSDYFLVFTDNADESLRILAGAIFIVDDSYYYVDFNEISLTDIYSFDPYEYDSLVAHTITDESLAQGISEAYTLYLGDGTNFLLDENFTAKLSKIFFIIFLGIIPCIIAIVFLILTLRSKGIYRKLCAIVCSTSLASSILFTILFTVIMHYN